MDVADKDYNIVVKLDFVCVGIHFNRVRTYLFNRIFDLSCRDLDEGHYPACKTIIPLPLSTADIYLRWRHVSVCLCFCHQHRTANQLNLVRS